MLKGKLVAAFPQAGRDNEEELGEYMLGLRTMAPEDMAGVL
jgi:simple sugar transport system ATP-binding protein